MTEGGLARAVAAFHRQAFAALLEGEAPPLAAIAEAASRDSTGVAAAISWLEAGGRLERDGERLVGAHGLTLRPTAHTLTIGDRTLHTWCAYDAVGIPVALGVTAQAATTCPTCGRALAVDIEAGQLPAAAPLALWMPCGPCEHLREDFCADANLFCDVDHLDAWRRGAGDPVGDVVLLGEVAALARVMWADVADILSAGDDVADPPGIAVGEIQPGGPLASPTELRPQRSLDLDLPAQRRVYPRRSCKR